MTLADEKQGFSRRLKDAMRKGRMEPASPTRVAREFNLRYHGDPVTTPAIRKWLAGEALPSQDKIRVLAQWLEVSPQWLRYGEAGGREERGHALAKQDTGSYQLDSVWAGKKFELLSEPHRKLVLEVMRALLRLEGKQ